MIRELAWRAIARIVTIPAVTDWLIARAQRTPYTHIPSRDGDGTYMGRWWLFNPYGRDENDNATPARWQRLPSIRVHHIMEPDKDDHCHDHPWNARTIVLRNGYDEERLFTATRGDLAGLVEVVAMPDGARAVFRRERGYTGRLLFGQYHRISHIPKGGAWTLFFTWPYQGTWGFLVDGVKVPWRKYLGLEKA